jgi:hypothetical protein
MNRTAAVVACLVAFVLSASALFVALTLINNRGLGFGFTPLCVAPAFVVAAVLGVAIVKKKERVFWLVAPTIGAAAVLLLFANFLFSEYRKHGQQTAGGGAGVAVLLLFGLGALLAAVYGAFGLGFLLRSKKTGKTGEPSGTDNSGASPLRV